MSIPGPELRQVKKTVAAESTPQAATLLNEDRQTITEALQNKPPVVIVAGNGDEKKSHKWDIAQIIITGIVGVGVWYTQNKVTTATQTITQAISTRYVLTQEYDKEKFKAYQRAMEHLSTLENTLAGASYGAAPRRSAIKAYTSLAKEIDHAEFYFSPETLKELQKVISLTASAKVIDPLVSCRTSDVIDQIKVVKMKIRDEVRAETAPSPPVHK